MASSNGAIRAEVPRFRSPHGSVGRADTATTDPTGVGDPRLRSYSVNCNSAFHELQLFDADLSQFVVGLEGKGLFVVCKQNDVMFSGHSVDCTTLVEKKFGSNFSFTATSFAFCNFIRTKEYTSEYIIPPVDIHDSLYDSKWKTLPIRKYTKSVNGTMVICKWCELPKFVKLVNNDASVVLVLTGIKLFVYDKKNNVLTAAEKPIEDNGDFVEQVYDINVQSDFGRLVRLCVRRKPQDGYECVLTKKDYVFPDPLRVVYRPEITDSVATVDKVIKLSKENKWDMQNKSIDWTSIPSSNRPLLINKTMFKQTFRAGDIVKFNVKVMEHTDYEIDMQLFLELAHEESDGKLDRYDYNFDSCYDSPRTVFTEMLHTKTRAFWDNDPKNKIHLSGEKEMEFNSSYFVFRIHDKVFDTRYGRDMKCMIFDLTRREKILKCTDLEKKYDKKMQVDRNCVSRMLYYYANRCMSKLSTTSGSVKCEKGMIEIRNSHLCPLTNSVDFNDRYFMPNSNNILQDIEANDYVGLKRSSWKSTFELTKKPPSSASNSALKKPMHFPDTLSKCTISPDIMLYKDSGDVGIYGHDYTTLSELNWLVSFTSETKDYDFSDKVYRPVKKDDFVFHDMPPQIVPSTFEKGNRYCQAGEFFENHLHTEVPHNGIPGDWSQGVNGFFLENSHPIECSLNKGGLRKWTKTGEEMPTLPLRLYRCDKYEIHSTMHPWGNVKVQPGKERSDMQCTWVYESNSKKNHFKKKVSIKGDFYQEIKFLPIPDREERQPYSVSTSSPLCNNIPGWEDNTSEDMNVGLKYIYGTEFVYSRQDDYKGMSDEVPTEVKKHCVAISRQESGFSFSEDATVTNFVSDYATFSQFNKVHPPPRLHDGSFFFSCSPFTKDFVSWFVPVDKSLEEVEQTIVIPQNVNAKCYSKDTSSIQLSIGRLKEVSDLLKRTYMFISPRYKPLKTQPPNWSNAEHLKHHLEHPDKRLFTTGVEQDIRIKQLLPDFVKDQSRLDSTMYQDQYDTAYSKNPYSNREKEGDKKLGHNDVSVTYKTGAKNYQLRMNIRVRVTGFDECEVTIILLDIYDIDTKEIIKF